MKTIRLSMAQALLKFLSQQYIVIDDIEKRFVQGMFGIFGHGNVTGLGEALQFTDHEQLPYIRANNEQGMVHAATAYAKQVNRLGIYACTSSIGPGATNMITGAACATTNRIPVLLLPGDVFACRQPDPVLQQLEDPTNYTVSPNDCFKAVSRYWDRINRPEQLMTACLNAFRVLTDPIDTGAVTLCLPQDVQAEVYNYPDSFFEKRVWRIERREPDTHTLDAVVNTIKKSKRVVIIAGGGVHYALATETLRHFANEFGFPVCETQAGKSVMTWEDDMCVGGVGVTGSQAANTLLRKADCVLAIGTRLQDFTTFSKMNFIDENAKLIQLNISRFDGYKMDAICLQADAKQGLLALHQKLKNNNRNENYIDEIKKLKLQWHDEVDRLYALTSDEGNTQTGILGVLNKLVSKEDVIVCAAGSLPGDLHKLWRCKQAKDYHVEYAYSTMGYEVSGGFGVKLAKADGEIYVIVGDGSFLMLHSELLTSIQEGVKINIILLDNDGFQCIRNLQMSQGGNSYGTERRYRDKTSGQCDGEVATVNFCQYANALGVNTFFANDIHEFEKALIAAKASAISTLIEIKTLPNSMSGGYDSFWRVGVSSVSNEPAVKEAAQAMQNQVDKARQY